MTTTAVPPLQAQSVFRGVSQADCIRQAEEDAGRARANGYEVDGQFWSESAGAQVLTVVYRYIGIVAPPRAAPPQVSSTGTPIGPLLGIAGGGLVSLGAFLPWLSASTALFSASRSGIDGGGDGVYFAAGGLVAALLGVVGLTQGGRRVAGLLVVAGILGLVGTYVEWQSISERLAALDDNVLGSIGIGIWAIGTGSALTILAGVAAER